MDILEKLYLDYDPEEDEFEEENYPDEEYIRGDEDDFNDD